MNHNPFNLQVGEIVIIDDKYVNGGEVIIRGFTENELFAIVECDGSIWQTMTCRLSPIKKWRKNNGSKERWEKR